MMGSSRILVVLNKPLFDQRTVRLLRGLAEDGFDVRVLCPDTKNRVVSTRLRGVRTYRAKPRVAQVGVGLGNPLYALVAVLSILLLLPKRVILIDVPYIALLLIAKTLGMTTTVDLHENYSAMVASWAERSSIHRFLHRARWFDRYQATLLPLADCIYVVCEENGDVASSRHRVNPNRIQVIGNTDRLSPYSRVHIRAFESDVPLRVVYSGAFNPNRGLVQFAEALRQYSACESRRVVFDCIGDGATLRELQMLQSIVCSEKAGLQILLPGWLPYSKVVQRHTLADIFAIPHLADEHIQTTYPNKVFEYLGTGKPLLVTQDTPLERIAVVEFGQGAAMNPEIPSSVRRAIDTLIQSYNNSVAGTTPPTAILAKYDWQRSYRALRCR